MPFYEGGAAKGGFEAGVRTALEAILASPHFIFRLERAPTDARSGGTLSRRGHRPRVAAVLLPLGHAARRGAPRRRRAHASCRRSPASRSRRAACSPIRAPRRSPTASRRSGCACRTSTRSIPIRTSTRTSTRTSPTRCARDGAVLRQPRQRDRSLLDLLTRRLHVPERAARAALRHPRRHRQRLPPRRRIPTRRAAASSARARCWCRPRSPTARRRCCAASG